MKTDEAGTLDFSGVPAFLPGQNQTGCLKFLFSGKRLPGAGRADSKKRGYNELGVIIMPSQYLKEVGAVKTVVLIMRRASLAQGLMAKAQNDPGFQLCYEPDYANADVAIRRHLAAGALVEVTEDGEYDMDFCLALCTWLREVTPDCRLTLMCPETQQETVNRAIAAILYCSTD